MIITTLAAAALATQAPTLRPGLEPLSFLVGHCWRGTFATGEQDTHCFQSLYDGQHVRDEHTVIGGDRVYRGETLYSADGSSAVSYTYWNSQGGVSRGAMQPRPDRLDFGVETYRGPDGREARLSTFWRRVGDDAYEAVTESADMPSMNRTVTYRRVLDIISSSNAGVAISELVDTNRALTLVHEASVGAPAHQVWQAISTAEGWTTWAVPVAWMDGDLLETSYTPGATRGDSSTIRQQIVARVPGRMLVFRTSKAPDGFPNFETFRQIVHVLEVEPVSLDESLVRLTSAGYPDTEAGRQLLGFFREGNRISLNQLRQRFTTGPIDWSRRQAATMGER